MLYITSDHRGFQLKSEIVKFLKEQGVEVQDLGPYGLDESDDYPDYTLRLVEKLKEDILVNKGIIICKNGVGVSMLANKFRDIRAALSWNPEHAVSSRLDDNSNILALPAAFINTNTALETVRAWLKEDFSGAERHRKRLDTVNNFGQ